MKTSYYVAAAVALVAGGWVLSGQFHEVPATEPGEASPAAADTALPMVRVRQQTAEPRAVEVILRGRTEAVRHVEVRAETKGKIVEVLAEKGSIVEEGALLARISDDDRQARLQQSKALLAQREVEYNAAAKLSKQGFKSETATAEAMANLEEARAMVASMAPPAASAGCARPATRIWTGRSGLLSSAASRSGSCSMSEARL